MLHRFYSKSPKETMKCSRKIVFHYATECSSPVKTDKDTIDKPQMLCAK